MDFSVLLNIQELARRMSEAKLRVDVLGARNVPMGMADRVSLDAQYTIALSAADKAHHEYTAAIAKLSAAEMRDLQNLREFAEPQSS